TLALDEDRAARTVLAEIRATYSNGTNNSSNPLLRAVDVVRPPLMLVHGLGGGPEDWNDFRDTSGKRLRDDTRFRVRHVPQMRGSGAYNESRDLLLGPFGGAEGKSFVSPIALLRSQGYACNRVDYVGHSMGGTMLRAALQDVPNYLV